MGGVPFLVHCVCVCFQGLVVSASAVGAVCGRRRGLQQGGHLSTPSAASHLATCAKRLVFSDPAQERAFARRLVAAGKRDRSAGVLAARGRRCSCSLSGGGGASTSRLQQVGLSPPNHALPAPPAPLRTCRPLLGEAEAAADHSPASRTCRGAAPPPPAPAHPTSTRPALPQPLTALGKESPGKGVPTEVSRTTHSAPDSS